MGCDHITDDLDVNLKKLEKQFEASGAGKHTEHESWHNKLFSSQQCLIPSLEDQKNLKHLERGSHDLQASAFDSEVWRDPLRKAPSSRDVEANELSREIYNSQSVTKSL